MCQERNNMRIGIGSDVHRLVEGRKLIIAGVVIPSEKGELAHSDGDVLYHALADAILGALALGDIGIYFPDTIETTYNMDSADIIRFVYDKMMERNYQIGNVDVTITLEKPKLKDYRQAMRNNIAALLNTDVDNISIKAGTNEGLDDIGHGLAIRVDAIVLLKEC